MSLQLQLVLIIGSVLFFIITIYHIRNSSLDTRQSLRWFAGAVVLLLLAFFPGVVEVIARWAGVEVPSNLIFLVVIAYLLLTSLSLSAVISREHARTKRLVQDIALLENRVEELEKQLTAAANKAAEADGRDSAPDAEAAEDADMKTESDRSAKEDVL